MVNGVAMVSELQGTRLELHRLYLPKYSIPQIGRARVSLVHLSNERTVLSILVEYSLSESSD